MSSRLSEVRRVDSVRNQDSLQGLSGYQRFRMDAEMYEEADPPGGPEARTVQRQFIGDDLPSVERMTAEWLSATAASDKKNSDLSLRVLLTIFDSLDPNPYTTSGTLQRIVLESAGEGALTYGPGGLLPVATDPAPLLLPGDGQSVRIEIWSTKAVVIAWELLYYVLPGAQDGDEAAILALNQVVGAVVNDKVDFKDYKHFRAYRIVFDDRTGATISSSMVKTVTISVGGGPSAYSPYYPFRADVWDVNDSKICFTIGDAGATAPDEMVCALAGRGIYTVADLCFEFNRAVQALPNHAGTTLAYADGAIRTPGELRAEFQLIVDPAAFAGGLAPVTVLESPWISGFFSFLRPSVLPGAWSADVAPNSFWVLSAYLFADLNRIQ